MKLKGRFFGACWIKQFSQGKKMKSMLVLHITEEA